MWKAVKFYLTLFRDLPSVFRSTIDFYVFWVSAAIALLSYFSSDLAQRVSVDLPLRREYAPYTVALVVLYGLLRANYVRFQRIERERDEMWQQVKDLTSKPTVRAMGIAEWIHQAADRFHYRLVLRNDGPTKAENVQVRLQAIEPRPSYAGFRGEFPYPLADLHGHRGMRDIGANEEEPYLLAQSWVSQGQTTTAGLDGRIEGVEGPLHDWIVPLDGPCTLRLTVSHSDTIFDVLVALNPKNGQLNATLLS